MAGGVSGVGASGNVQKSQSKDTEAEKKQAVEQTINASVNQMQADKGKTSYFGQGRIDKAKAKMTEEMAKWMQANPNATAEEAAAEAKKNAAKNQTKTMFAKMQDDNFFKKLMSRRKELMGDMWG
jgi:hypothetical protein